MFVAIARFPEVPTEREAEFRAWFAWSNDLLRDIDGLQGRRLLRAPDGSYTALVEHKERRDVRRHARHRGGLASARTTRRAPPRRACRNDVRGRKRPCEVGGPAAVVGAVMVVNAGTTWLWSVSAPTRRLPAAAAGSPERRPVSSLWPGGDVFGQATDQAAVPKSTFTLLVCISFATGEAEDRWPRVGFEQCPRSRRGRLARRTGLTSAVCRARTKRRSLMHYRPNSPDLNGWPGTLSRSRRRLHCATRRENGPIRERVQFPQSPPRCPGGPWRRHQRNRKMRRRSSLLTQAHIGSCKSCPSDATH